MNEKSCFNCPSLLTTNEEQVAFFGKAIGVPTCARYGRVMGNPAMIAKNCVSFGEPKPASPDWSKLAFTVALPDPKVFKAERNQPEVVASCLACINYIKPQEVWNHFGWSPGLCSAKGKLILGNRLTFEARGCEYSSLAEEYSVRPDIRELIMLPEYSDDLVPTSDPVKNFFQEQKKEFVDPVDYPSDKEVDDEDKKSGIRAWREITDPITENSVYLPIYDLDFFSEEERAKIPRTGSDEHPEDYVDHNFYTYRTAVLWTELDETPGLWGEPGTGKTEFFRYMAWLMCLPFERISITGSTELEDLAGKMHFSKEQGTYFEYGRVPQAWTKPCVMVIDEPNVGPPDVWQFLRPMTDNSKQLVLDVNKGERLSRHNDCYLGLAMNPAWDVRNVGAQMISDADVNRLMHMYIELPPPELEREIIKTRCTHDGWSISEGQLNTIMGIAKDVRALVEQGTLPITWAIRPQLKVARAVRWFDYMTAYRMASADFLEPEAQQRLLDVVRAHVSS